MKTEDYIPPRMFTSCTRCKDICHEGDKEFMCLNCQNARLAMKNDLRDIRAEQQRSLTVKAVRESIAETLTGLLNPLWWKRD